MYSKILVPLDGSKRAESILPHVEELAHRYNSEVIFLEVLEPEPIVLAPEPLYTTTDPQSYERRVNDVKTYLAARQGEFREKGIKAQTRMAEGPVVEMIIKTATELDVDLIAMASHGRTGLARVFYGSIAAGVLHRIDRPILLVRALGNGNQV